MLRMALIGKCSFSGGSFLFFFPGASISQRWQWMAPELETSKRVLSNNIEMATPRWTVGEPQAFQQSGDY